MFIFITTLVMGSYHGSREVIDTAWMMVCGMVCVCVGEVHVYGRCVCWGEMCVCKEVHVCGRCMCVGRCMGVGRFLCVGDEDLFGYESVWGSRMR